MVCVACNFYYVAQFDEKNDFAVVEGLNFLRVYFRVPNISVGLKCRWELFLKFVR